MQHQFEIVLTVAIAAGSLLLFGYWFRYTCLLILSAKTAFDYAGGMAASANLAFLGVQQELRNHEVVNLDPLHAALERDYTTLTRMLKEATQNEEQSSIEEQMLAAYYKLMDKWYRTSRSFSPQAARRALEEMSTVVGHFANILGEQAACGSPA
jgi:Skp family chaperone for outer membrane proteins